jgi:hypothetical protein
LEGYSGLLQLFELCEAGSEYGQDFELFLCKLKVENVRFMIWGEDVGIWTGNGDFGNLRQIAAP